MFKLNMEVIMDWWVEVSLAKMWSLHTVTHQTIRKEPYFEHMG